MGENTHAYFVCMSCSYRTYTLCMWGWLEAVYELHAFPFCLLPTSHYHARQFSSKMMNHFYDLQQDPQPQILSHLAAIPRICCAAVRQCLSSFNVWGRSQICRIANRCLNQSIKPPRALLYYYSLVVLGRHQRRRKDNHVSRPHRVPCLTATSGRAIAIALEERT